MALDYIRDPAEIYRLSFETVEREVAMERYSAAMQRVVTRLVHSCGMTNIVEDLDFSERAAEAGVAALQNDCAVYCDVEMVKAGIIERNLPGASRLVCTLNDKRAGVYGKAARNTRTASAVDFWDGLEGSICVIGNAPTALFRLLERMDEDGIKPALIIGIPVGFIGAVESKRELADNPRGSQFITVHGRRGGSAMASSVVNALSYLATGKS